MQLLQRTRVRSAVGVESLQRDAGALAIALLALSALDLVVTRFAIASLGAFEANPLFAPFVATDLGIVLKLGIPACVVFVASRVTRPHAVGALRLVLGIYVVVVLFGLVQVAVIVAQVL